MKTLQCLSLIFAVLLFGQIAFGQTDSAILSGTVFDLSNTKIPNVLIKAQNKNSEVFEAITNRNGNYSIYLKRGEYEIDFYASGFIITKITGYKVSSENNFQLDVALAISNIITSPLPNNSEIHKTSVVLSGKIYDREGATVLWAVVRLKSKTGAVFETKTNYSGVYEIEIPEGIYTIEFGTNFSKPFKIKNFRIIPSLDGKMNLDVALTYETFKEKSVLY